MTRTPAPVSPPVVDTVRSYAGYLPRLVVDPVMVAASGDRLLEPDAEDAYEDLLEEAALVTPNADEAVTAGIELLDSAVRYNIDVGEGPGAVHHLVDIRDWAAGRATAEAVESLVGALADRDVRFERGGHLPELLLTVRETRPDLSAACSCRLASDLREAVDELAWPHGSVDALA